MFLQMEASHEADVSGADLPRTIVHGRHILKADSRGFAGIPVRFLEGGGGGDACSLFLLASQPKRSQGEPRVANGSEWKIDGQIIIVARGDEWKR